MAGYPMGNQPFPGQGGPQGGYGYGQGWQQQGQPQPGGYGGQYPGQPQPGHGAPQYGYQQPAQGCFQGDSNHYGAYGNEFHQNVFAINAAQAFQYNSDAELMQVFESKKSQRFNAVQAEELCQILNETPEIRNYYRISWSLELCKIMIAMLDRSGDGMMQYQEFRELLQCLVFWRQIFSQYDGDNSGFIEAGELQNVVLNKFSYKLSQKAMTCILKRYSKALDDGRCMVAFDDFVSLSVRLRAYTEAFRARDRQRAGVETGRTEFGYDDFIQCTMCL